MKSIIDNILRNNDKIHKIKLTQSARAIFDYISYSLSLGTKVSLRGFGTFYTKKIQRKNAPPYIKIYFKCSKKLTKKS